MPDTSIHNRNDNGMKEEEEEGLVQESCSARDWLRDPHSRSINKNPRNVPVADERLVRFLCLCLWKFLNQPAPGFLTGGGFSAAHNVKASSLQLNDVCPAPIGRAKSRPKK